MIDYILSRFNNYSLDTQGLTPKNLFERSKREFVYIPRSETLAICLPGWSQRLYTWKRVRNYILRRKISFLAYEFPTAILSADYKLTKDCFDLINREVRKEITSLKRQYKFKKICLLGYSLSASLSSMIYKNNSDVTYIILIAPGNNLARDMWHGCRTQHIRKAYERQGVTEDDLANHWNALAPENNLPAQNTRVSLYFGKSDQVIPYQQSLVLARILSRNKFPIEIKAYSCGHYVMIIWFLLFPKRFLAL